MSRFATRYWLRDRPLSAQLWACLSLAEGLTLAAILLYVLLLLRPKEPGQWYRLAALFPLLLIANLFAVKLAARCITEPLKRLVGNLKRIKDRNWSEPVLQVTHRDEIGTIVNTPSQIQRNVVELNEGEEFFYQSVSHGLETPIMVIQNYCTAYQNDIYGPEAINIIMRESLMVEAGIRRLLYVSPFDRILGKQSDFRPVELQGLMGECRKRLRGNERGIQLEVNVPAGLTVSENEAALQTVFGNLVKNGLRYTVSYIRMKLTREKEDDCLLTVESDGVPILQPTLNILFQKFYKGADGNFGLDFCIAKRIVQFHKGDIWASNWADGMCFQFLLCKEDRMAGRCQKGTIRS